MGACGYLTLGAVELLGRCRNLSFIGARSRLKTPAVKFQPLSVFSLFRALKGNLLAQAANKRTDTKIVYFDLLSDVISKSSGSELIMSDLVCIICRAGAALDKILISNPEMIVHMCESCKERPSLGQNDIKSLITVYRPLSRPG